MKTAQQEKNLEQWTEINQKLSEKLDELEKLDLEREEIAGKIGKVSDESLREMMDISLENYKLLLSEIKTLRKKSEALKKKLQD